MFLYVITNLVNGKQYVGIAVHSEQRKREHYSGHGSKLVWQAIKKYGKENLHFEVWYEGNDDWIRTMECRAILMLETKVPQGYNLTLGGEGNTGWCPSAETRMKMSKTHSGSQNGMYGRIHLERTRQKMRMKAVDRKMSPEFSAMLKSMVGAKHPRARSVMVDGKVYGCIKDAAFATGINANALYMRLRRYTKSGNWPVGWGVKAPV